MPIPKQTPSKGRGVTITGPNESFGGGMGVGVGSHRHYFKSAFSALCPAQCYKGNKLLWSHSGQGWRPRFGFYLSNWFTLAVALRFLTWSLAEHRHREDTPCCLESRGACRCWSSQAGTRQRPRAPLCGFGRATEALVHIPPWRQGMWSVQSPLPPSSSCGENGIPKMHCSELAFLVSSASPAHWWAVSFRLGLDNITTVIWITKASYSLISLFLRGGKRLEHRAHQDLSCFWCLYHRLGSKG